MENFWMGNNQLVIVYENGTHHVLEAFENYKAVFTGSYADCLEYCKNEKAEYEKSLF